MSKEIENIKLVNVFHKENGDILAMAQIYESVYSSIVKKSGETVERTTHLYDDILILKINKSKELLWGENIQKKQITTNDNGRYSSFGVFNKDDDLYFLFNDHKDNNHILENQVHKIKGMNTPQLAYTTLVHVYSDGVTHRSHLYETKDLQVIQRPRFNYKLNDSEMLIYEEKGFKYRWGKLTFP